VPHAGSSGDLTHEVIIDIPVSVQALGDAKPFVTPGFVAYTETKPIEPVSDGHGGFRTTTVTRIHFVAEQVFYDTDHSSHYAGLPHDHVLDFGIQLRLPCWCTLSAAAEPFYNPPGERMLAALYFPVTQNITRPDGSTFLLPWTTKPASSSPADWGKPRYPTPVVYLQDSTFCSQCAQIMPDEEEEEEDEQNVGGTSAPVASSGSKASDDEVNALRGAVIALSITVVLAVAAMAVAMCVTLRRNAPRPTHFIDMTPSTNKGLPHIESSA
jgi:hypothetical protein